MLALDDNITSGSTLTFHDCEPQNYIALTKFGCYLRSSEARTYPRRLICCVLDPSLGAPGGWTFRVPEVVGSATVAADSKHAESAPVRKTFHA